MSFANILQVKVKLKVKKNNVGNIFHLFVTFVARSIFNINNNNKNLI